MADSIKMISTRGETPACSFYEAMETGLAPDGGLYIPDRIPPLPGQFWDQLPEMSLSETGREICLPYFDRDTEKDVISRVVRDSVTFGAPVVQLYENMYLLELFHGPTLAFKDFGARFMARAFASLEPEGDKKELLILVATSGDTGSAVANGFYGVKGTHVHLLYPSGKVSRLQEKQMTTLGGNVTALEVDGTFDDCQRLVKQAFSDRELGRRIRMSSANSINIARLLPQSFYYMHALGRLQKQFGKAVNPVFSVPSGNFGNLTAGLIAMRMGMPVSRFLAATNSNDVVPRFLETGTFTPRLSETTISNAMDVGNPSNFERILHLFDGSHEEIRKHIWGASFNDNQTRACIKKVYEETGRVLDPHTAVGVLTARKYREESGAGSDSPAVVLATAHPAKFPDVVEQETGGKIEIPEQLKSCLEGEKRSITMGNDYNSFRNFLVKEKW
ncbi:MAG: threonine synthase [Balneolaceae bacterium]